MSQPRLGEITGAIKTQDNDDAEPALDEHRADARAQFGKYVAIS